MIHVCSVRRPLAGLVLLSMLMLCGAAAAQDVGDEANPLTSEEAGAVLPDPGGYQLQLFNEALFRLLNQDLPPEAEQAIRGIIMDSVGRDHFYGAAFASLPEGSRSLSIHVRGKLHSLEAAQRSARSVCETARGPSDSECLEIGRILPKGWSEEMLQMSVEAADAFRQMAGQMPGPKVFARSRNTTGWSMMSGEGVREDALAECNEKVEAGGFEPDCSIVIAD